MALLLLTPQKNARSLSILASFQQYRQFTSFMLQIKNSRAPVFSLHFKGVSCS